MSNLHNELSPKAIRQRVTTKEEYINRARGTKENRKQKYVKYKKLKNFENIILAKLPKLKRLFFIIGEVVQDTRKTQRKVYTNDQLRTGKDRLNIKLNTIKSWCCVEYDRGETNSKGKKREELVEKEQLLIHNQGKVPTRSRLNVYRNWCYTGFARSGKGGKPNRRPP